MARVLTTPETIRTLQRKLYAKAKQEPAYRCYALYDKISRAEVLAHAWRLVRANQGSPGGDGRSCAALEGGSGIETFLRQRAQDLLWAVQGSHSSGLALGAYLGVKNIGKPCAGKLHARFDEGGQDCC